MKPRSICRDHDSDEIATQLEDSGTTVHETWSWVGVGHLFKLLVIIKYIYITTLGDSGSTNGRNLQIRLAESLTLASNLKQGNSCCWSSTLSMISQVHSLSLNGHMLLQDLKHQRTFWPAHPFPVCKRSHRTWSWKWSCTWKHQFRKNKLVVEWYRHALMCVDYYYFDQAHVSVTASAHTIGYNWNHDLHRRWLENHTEARLKLRRSGSV